MMIPITRKEKYINEIVGGGDTAPKTPQTREEFFFATILGEVVAPSPITRAEKYLAKIANKYNGELPEPVTRIERFLARAAGMNVSIPTPITREEMFWADYALIVEKELSGIPPLTFNAIAGALKNYRIYGNTVNGENVGDLITEGEHAGEYSVPVTVTNGTDTLTTNIYLPEQIRKVGDEAEYVDYQEQKLHRVRKNLVSDYNVNATKTRYDPALHCFADLMPNTNYIITFLMDSQTDFYTNEYVFEPIRYTNKLPGNKKVIVKTKETLNKNDIRQYRSAYGWIILKNNSEQTENPNISYVQIRLTSIEDDTYESYIENTDIDVTLPALPTIKGTNVLSVGTAVQASKVYIKYKGERQ